MESRVELFARIRRDARVEGLSIRELARRHGVGRPTVRRDQTSRRVEPGMIHHSDAGSQYTSIRFTETVALEGLVASIGSVGDAYDNAAAETVMGLFKNEAVRNGSPFRTGPLKTLADVEEITFDWVSWYNNERLHSYLGNVTPEEYEASYYADLTGPSADDAANKPAA